MRFRHKDTTLGSRDNAGRPFPVNKTYVVNQGKDPGKDGNPSVREGYKSIMFAQGFAETDDPEIIEFLRHVKDVTNLDEAEANAPKAYTAEEIDRIVEERIAAERREKMAQVRAKEVKKVAKKPSKSVKKSPASGSMMNEGKHMMPGMGAKGMPPSHARMTLAEHKKAMAKMGKK